MNWNAICAQLAFALLCLPTSQPVQRCECTPGPGAVELQEEPICDHHDDIWGFSVDLPERSCGDPYLHGISVTLPGVPRRYGKTPDRVVVIFAAYTPEDVENSRQLAARYVEAARERSVGRVSVVSRRAFPVGQTGGTRWVYRYRHRARRFERLVDIVTVLRAVRRHDGSVLSYEYAFILETMPGHYREEKQFFDRLLQTVSFSTPER